MGKGLFLCLIITLLLCPLTLQAKGFNTIYVLGDSLSDQGNMFLTTSKIAWPADEYQYFSSIPNTTFYNEGRFTNGENYVDRLAEKLKLVVLPTEAGGGNYAIGGAQVSSNVLLAPYLPSSFYYPLNVQSYNFAQDHNNIPDPESLYIVFSGSNDVSDQILRIAQNPTGGLETACLALDEAVKGVQRAVEAFIAAGARDILVSLVPDLGLIPATNPVNFSNSTAVSELATALTNYFNAKVVETLKGYTQGNIIVFDTASFLREMVADPSRYGLENVVAPCYNEYVYTPSADAAACDTPDTYLFWDFQHPTTVVHKLLADQMLQRVIEGILTDFIDDVERSSGLPEKTRDNLLKEIDKIKTLVIDKDQKNASKAIKNLEDLAETLESLGDSPLINMDTSSLSARALQLAELVKANL